MPNVATGVIITPHDRTCMAVEFSLLRFYSLTFHTGGQSSDTSTTSTVEQSSRLSLRLYTTRKYSSFVLVEFHLFCACVDIISLT